MNTIDKTFQFEGAQFRAVGTPDAPEFIAADWANALNYSSTAAMTRTLDDDEKGVHTLHTPGGSQQMTTITEAGLYSVILRSRVPQAKAFKRWVTHEVLPQIRRTGRFQAAEVTKADLARMVLESEAELEAARSELKALEPKRVFADAVAASEGTILIGELAKILRGNGVQIGQNRLFEDLRREGFLISRKGSDWNMPTQRSMELGLFRIKETAVTHSDGHVSISKTPKVTGKGQEYFINRYLNGDGEVAA